jgi:asparagine synthase (glutamine-hydrolysing)
VLERLNGMWALAVWDRDERRLFLARDRLGVKPLVYSDTPNGFVFSSEIKALAASGLVRRELDPDVLPHYLCFFAIPDPHSLVRRVRRLPAGHTLTVDAEGVRERRYWDCDLPEDEEDRGRRAYREEIAALLDDSVRRRLVSDVPLGVLLSSGVDSSLVTAVATRHREEPLSTFTLGFGSAGGDEREPARRLAGALGAKHMEAETRPSDIGAKLPDLLEAYDEPGESLLQTYFVCELAARDVTVALSGLGGDELFSAYPSHVVANLLARLDGIPAALRGPALALARGLPAGRLSRAATLAAMEPDERASGRLMHQTEARLRSDLLAPNVRAALDLDAPARHLETHFERARGVHPLNRMLYVYVKTYLSDELLRASDAMSMIHSLELRTPFLDYRLVERAMSIPAHHKMRLTKGKLLLRDLAEEVLPVSLPRGKRGFAPPLGTWIRGDLRESVRDLLAPPAVQRRGLFEPAAVERLVRACLNGDDRAVPPVMMLYCFEAWARRWLDGQPGWAEAAIARPQVPQRVPAADRDLSVVIVNWNTRERLRACLASIERHLGSVEHEVIVVDNASSDGSAEMVAAEFPRTRLIRNAKNVGFGRANNQAMREAAGRWFLLLNSDTELLDGSVASLFSRLNGENGIGMAHCKLVLPDGRLQHSVYRFPSLRLSVVESLGLYKLLPERTAGSVLLGGYWDQASERDVDWVFGAFMLLPRAVFEQTGGFDEHLFMYGEDLEWCYRIRDQGWRIRYFPEAAVRHFDHVSSDLRWGDERVALSLRSQRDIYRERHGPIRATALVALGIAGAALRVAYYSLRHQLGGPRAEGYAEMRRHTAHSLRILLSLAGPRR